MAAGAEQPTEARDAPFAVYRHNWLTVQLWRALWPRWRRDGHGRRQALDLAQVESALRLRRVPKADWPAIDEGLRVMEDEAIGIWTSED